MTHAKGQMVAGFTTAFILVLTLQSTATPQDRSQAEAFARAGRTAEAVRLFERIVQQDPTDIDARMWMAVLELRLGRTEQAEAAFRAVIRVQPSHIGARIGLGAALTRRGDWPGALSVLQEVEREAGENSDLFAALGRAYRRAGNDQRALDYLTRARALAPDDPDVAQLFEDTVAAYGHSIAVDGYGEHRSDGSTAGVGSTMITVRARPGLHLFASARLDQRSDSSEAIVGGGFRWRAARSTTLSFRAMGASGNESVPNLDMSSDLIQQAGMFEIGGSIRVLSFAQTDVLALSPVMAVDRGGRFRLDTRYTYSRSSFETSGETSGDHSVLLRPTWRAFRRVALNATYAYGIESFENLTSELVGLGNLRATTVAAGLRITLRSRTTLSTIWEHQWLSNSGTVDRVGFGMVQSFP
jgi:thioredoxin-like negative regulator of GroEL